MIARVLGGDEYAVARWCRGERDDRSTERNARRFVERVGVQRDDLAADGEVEPIAEWRHRRVRRIRNVRRVHHGALGRPESREPGARRVRRQHHEATVRHREQSANRIRRRVLPFAAWRRAVNHRVARHAVDRPGVVRSQERRFGGSTRPDRAHAQVDPPRDTSAVHKRLEAALGIEREDARLAPTDCVDVQMSVSSRGYWYARTGPPPRATRRAMGS